MYPSYQLNILADIPNTEGVAGHIYEKHILKPKDVHHSRTIPVTAEANIRLSMPSPNRTAKNAPTTARSNTAETLAISVAIGHASKNSPHPGKKVEIPVEVPEHLLHGPPISGSDRDVEQGGQATFIPNINTSWNRRQRMWRWCKRNPYWASFIALVLLFGFCLLVIGVPVVVDGGKRVSQNMELDILELSG
jgi:hypothetical protein